jgi:fructose-bisphosphate aldolase class II
MLVDAARLLDDAAANGYAVGSFNAFDMHSALGIADALRARHSPGIIAVTNRHVPIVDLEGFAAFVAHLAHRVDVPVALHLDHATDLQLIRRALEAGFTSVMYDGSSFPMEDRIQRTREFVEISHDAGATAEAELDHLGRLGVERGGGYTDPRRASTFAADTGIDILAVSIGNVHGALGTPVQLDLNLLQEIRSQVGCRLSIHGGTGVPPDQLVAAIERGISKVSFFHALADAALHRVRSAAPVTPPGEIAALAEELRAGFRETCAGLIDVLGSQDRGVGPSRDA